MKICLIGASGFLGKKIAEALDACGVDWVGTTLRESARDNLIKITKHNKDDLINIVDSYNVVINASGSLKPKDFELYTESSLKEFWTNINFFSEVYAASKIKTLVNISSAGTVYGEKTRKGGSEETDFMNPISWYGRSKMLEELHYEYLCNQNNINFTNCRVANPYGNDECSKHGFIDVLINCVKEGKPFSLYAGKSPRRDFVSSVDMARMITNLVINKAYGTYNVASGESYALSEIVELLPKSLGVNDFSIEYKGNKPSHEVLISEVSVKKIKELGFYEKSTSIESYLEKSLRN